VHNLTKTSFAVAIIIFVSGCATTLDTTAGHAISNDAYNNAIAQQGQSHYCSAGNCDTPPLLIQATAPKYPATELVEGRSGVVSVLFDIEQSGEVSNLKIESATSQAFAEATLQAIKTWRFKPAMLGGQPIKMFGLRQLTPFHPN
jgi:TonB family protein